jgi:hypothetical protein
VIRWILYQQSLVLEEIGSDDINANKIARPDESSVSREIIIMEPLL